MGKHDQRGAALIVSMVLLVVALLLGLSSFQTSRMEESMAGNHRAAANALMAAEYGASGMWSDISGTYSGEADFEDSMSMAGWAEVSGSDASYYTVSCCNKVGLNYVVEISGGVFSGSPSDGGVLISERILQILARRDGMGFGRLSPFNSASEFEDFGGVRSQAEYEGEEATEEYDGTPAISASSREDAFDIVRDILKLGEDAQEQTGHGKYTFVPSDPNDPDGDGIFYAAPTVNSDGVYTGDYSSCNSGPNRLCNYKGGISTQPAEAILGYSGDAFHVFMQTLFSDAYSSNGTGSLQSGVSDVTIVSNGSHFDESGSYQPVREWVCDEVDESDCSYVYPERDPFSSGQGGFSGEGFLVIDGDVVFNGDPGFKGIIIVLGDYEISGGGGSDFEGAIVAAPYSCEETPPSGVPPCRFDPVRVDISGGGGNDYRHSLSALDSAWEALVDASPAAAEAWFQGNNPSGNWAVIASSWVEKVNNN
ncbi:PilX N-terminal domain-containing pilus assembly protein [Halomonas salifodinae]|uniref:PilX N-terminal domain-containing pilus assembly protein n=1 Tax=Halomonas salifodinae TaxID=438745 RepID=UPI0033B13A77